MVSSETQDSSSPPSNNADDPSDPHPVPPPLTNLSPIRSIPLPPPETGALPKEPGLTRRSLEKLTIHDVMDASGTGSAVDDHSKKASASTAGDATPSSETSSPDSSSDWTEPSTRPPSKPASRTPSVNDSMRPAPPTAPAPEPQLPLTRTKSETEKSSDGAPHLQDPPLSPSSLPSSKSPSLHEPEKHRFTLKDLLAHGPKLVRKSSARSTGSSKKSDSDGERRSNAESDSLSKKYGVCTKVPIGKGATSVVRLAHKWDRSEEKLYAIKEFRKKRRNETEREYVKKLTAEFCISSALHHMNIVETVDLIQDESQHWCEVMEFCPGGDLYAAIKKGGMSSSEVECCFKQILSGVAYLHSQGVAHRDIKPENLFFDDKNHLKIGDYGASTVYRLPWESTVHMSSGLCGSEPYIAPEQFLGKPYDARLVDIWACGIVYYCLHFQELPWRVAQISDQLYASYASACAAQSHNSTQNNHNSSPSSFPPTVNNLSPRACRPVIRKMLEPIPKLRTLIEDVMNHPWVQGIEVCYLASKPKHVHGHARGHAQSQLKVIGGG